MSETDFSTRTAPRPKGQKPAHLVTLILFQGLCSMFFVFDVIEDFREGGVSLLHMLPEIGATLLHDAEDDMFRLAAEVALTHHEKFDGSGYPYGRKAEEIPLSGRIVAVADFFDALTMDRCYRPALSDEQAFEMLREGVGTHFDPEVVEAFFLAQDRIIETRTRINATA